MSDPATNMAESWNDIDVKLEALQIDRDSASGSCGQNGQQD
jgi:hypothetical protein